MNYKDSAGSSNISPSFPLFTLIISYISMINVSKVMNLCSSVGKINQGNSIFLTNTKGIIASNRLCVLKIQNNFNNR